MKRFRGILAGLSLALAGLLSLTPAAKADIFQTYDLAWSGATFSNSSSATGVMTLDLSTLINPTPIAGGGGLDNSGYEDIISDITRLSVVVTGAGAGNGTFLLANLAPDSAFGSYTYWFTNGVTLNMEGNVLSQLQAAGGDFNLFFAPPGPDGSSVLTLTTDGLGGNPMSMTEFAPSVPEPDSMILVSATLIVLGFAARKRIARGKA